MKVTGFLSTYPCLLGLCFPFICNTPQSFGNLRIMSKFLDVVDLIIGVRIVVEGQENLATHHSCIVVSNHQSYFDLLGLIKITTIMGKFAIVAAGFLKQIYYVLGLFGPYYGYVFIPMDDTKTAIAILDNTCIQIKKDNANLYIRPEGAMINDGAIHKFKKGAFHLAIKHQLPIVPIVYSRPYFYSKEEYKFDQGTIFLSILPPISTENLTKNDVTRLTEDTRDIMVEKYNQLNLLVELIN